jgi:hypothetical protein
VKARVWGYRDGTLLPDGFEADATTTKGYDDDVALVPCLLALLESVGIEACIGNDDDSDPDDLGFNGDVEDWKNVTENAGSLLDLARELTNVTESRVEDVEEAHRAATMEAWAREMTGETP